jgi:predicted DNA binding CopG/RHH family protein
MAKTRKLTVLVDEELYRRIKHKSVETGIPFSVVARRALERWVKAGEMPATVHEPPEEET